MYCVLSDLVTVKSTLRAFTVIKMGSKWKGRNLKVVQFEFMLLYGELGFISDIFAMTFVCTHTYKVSFA